MIEDSMKEDPLGACKGIMNGCLGVIGMLVLITVIVFILLRGI